MLDILAEPKQAIPRKLPNYKLFLDAQNRYVSQVWKVLYDSTGYLTAGVSFLIYILSQLDLDYMNDQVNNYDRYTHHLRYIRDSVLPHFNTLTHGKPYRKLFFASQGLYTQEYLIPTDDAGTMTYLPLHTDNWNVWKRIRPLRLWTHDSDEFTVHLKNDRLKFQSFPPGYAIELLDIVALLFKYYFWFTQKRLQEDIPITNPEAYFIHKYVLCDWVWDCENIWLLSCLKKVLAAESVKEVTQLKPRNLQVDPNWGRIAINCTKGFEQLWYLTKGTKKYLKPDAILNAKLLANGSLRDRIILLQTRLSLPPLRQYRYLSWLKDRDTLQLYLQILSFRQTSESRGIFRKYVRDMRRILAIKPWNVCDNLILQDQIETEMNEFVSWASAYG